MESDMNPLLPCAVFFKNWLQRRMQRNNLQMIAAVQHEESNSQILSGLLGSEKHLRPQNYGDVIQSYSDEDFFRLFRMKKRSFDLLLTNLMAEPKFSTLWTRGSEPLSPSRKALAAIMYLSSQESMRKIGDKFDMADSSVMKSVNDFMEGMAGLRDRFIMWPHGEDQAVIAQQFENIANLKGVIGAIDGTHIEGKIPKEVGGSYINRKSRKTVILQATCTAKKLFTSTFVGCPGRMHDARVLSMSCISQRPETLFGSNDVHLIGDSAYPLKMFLITPYKKNRNLTRAEVKFNTVHSKTRVVIENAYGLLKGRWRRLLYVDVQSVEQIIKIIETCCILHNFCLLQDDFIEDLDMMLEEHAEDLEEDRYAAAHRSQEYALAQAKRDMLKNML